MEDWQEGRAEWVEDGIRYVRGLPATPPEDGYHRVVKTYADGIPTVWADVPDGTEDPRRNYILSLGNMRARHGEGVAPTMEDGRKKIEEAIKETNARYYLSDMLTFVGMVQFVLTFLSVAILWRDALFLGLAALDMFTFVTWAASCWLLISLNEKALGWFAIMRSPHQTKEDDAKAIQAIEMANWERIYEDIQPMTAIMAIGLHIWTTYGAMLVTDAWHLGTPVIGLPFLLLSIYVLRVIAASMLRLHKAKTAWMEVVPAPSLAEGDDGEAILGHQRRELAGLRLGTRLGVIPICLLAIAPSLAFAIAFVPETGMDVLMWIILIMSAYAIWAGICWLLALPKSKGPSAPATVRATSQAKEGDGGTAGCPQLDKKGIAAMGETLAKQARTRDSGWLAERGRRQAELLSRAREGAQEAIEEAFPKGSLTWSRFTMTLDSGTETVMRNLSALSDGISSEAPGPGDRDRFQRLMMGLLDDNDAIIADMGRISEELGRIDRDTNDEVLVADSRDTVKEIGELASDVALYGGRARPEPLRIARRYR